MKYILVLRKTERQCEMIYRDESFKLMRCWYRSLPLKKLRRRLTACVCKWAQFDKAPPPFALICKAIIIHSAVIQNKGRYIVIIEAKGGPCTCEMSHSLEMQIGMLSTSSIPTLLMVGMLPKIFPIPSLTRKQFWITLLQHSPNLYISGFKSTATALVCPQVQVGCKGFTSVLKQRKWR